MYSADACVVTLRRCNAWEGERFTLSERTDTAPQQVAPETATEQPPWKDLRRSGARSAVGMSAHWQLRPRLGAKGLVLLLAYALSVAILGAVVGNVWTQNGQRFEGVGLPRGELGSEATQFRSRSLAPNASFPPVALNIEVIGLDVGQHTARLQVSARVRPEALTPEQLRAYQGGPYSDGKPGLPVSILGYGETFVYRVIQLSGEHTRDSAKTTYLAYPSGSTSRYPFDGYVSTLGVAPPSGLPVALGVSLSPAWSDPFVLAARDITGTFPREERSAEFLAVALEARRSMTAGGFALLVALSPMFLLVIAWHQLSFDRRGRRARQRSEEHVAKALPLELGAAFLALLTLRQVLVPGDISGPTVIDGILALELSLFVALLVQAWAARDRRVS